MDARRLFSIDNSPRRRSNGVKLRCKQVQLDCTKFFFTNEVFREWNKLPPLVVQCDTINYFKNKLDQVSNKSKQPGVLQAVSYRLDWLTKFAVDCVA